MGKSFDKSFVVMFTLPENMLSISYEILISIVIITIFLYLFYLEIPNQKQRSNLHKPKLHSIMIVFIWKECKIPVGRHRTASGKMINGINYTLYHNVLYVS